MAGGQNQSSYSALRSVVASDPPTGRTPRRERGLINGDRPTVSAPVAPGSHYELSLPQQPWRIFIGIGISAIAALQ